MERGGQGISSTTAESIYSLGNLITRLVPEAKIGIANGQRGRRARAGHGRLRRHKHDVLSPPRSENGLEFPTPTPDHQPRDRYGLSQLYQLRGRVGRSTGAPTPTSDSAGRGAVRGRQEETAGRDPRFSDSVSGFRVAALDLEIRVAGTCLGEPSGTHRGDRLRHVRKAPEQTIKELKGEDIEDISARPSTSGWTCA